MKLIIDANIIFSAIIKNNITRNLIFNKHLDLITTSYVLEEIFKHRNEIKLKANLKDDEVNLLIIDFAKRISIIKETELEEFFDESIKICPDINDVHYFALALKLNCPIWTNDKKLKEQNVIKTINTQELINLMESI